MQQLKLYPVTMPNQTAFMKTSDGHEIYWEECGNPEGVPIVFLHGGPGAGCAPYHRRYFDPKYYRIILLDQRGAGRSKPLASLKHNTTWSLISDLEQLRRILNIENWILFGGSWGSTLALVYAQTHPDIVRGLILRGVFLGTDQEVEWFMTSMGRFFPEAQSEFLKLVPPEKHGDWRAILGFYNDRLKHSDRSVHARYARSWSRYEMRCCALIPDERLLQVEEDLSTALPLARLEAHFFTHKMFLESHSILDHMHALDSKPGIIVQGRYDVVCPPISAMKVHEKWHGSQLTIVADAGHSATEPGITQALLKATQNAKNW